MYVCLYCFWLILESSINAEGMFYTCKFGVSDAGVNLKHLLKSDIPRIEKLKTNVTGDMRLIISVTFFFQTKTDPTRSLVPLGSILIYRQPTSRTKVVSAIVKRAQPIRNIKWQPLSILSLSLCPIKFVSSLIWSCSANCALQIGCTEWNEKWHEGYK
jgi:hypothetical protein